LTQRSNRYLIYGMSLTDRHDLDEAETADRLGVAQATLRNWRFRGLGPAYLKVGRKVWYRAADIADWLDAQRQEPQSAHVRRASA
jgi:hypothetical protein